MGESFRQWPEEMRFISPSFNQQGWTKSFDLNSVAYGTSPAFTLHAEHPTGAQYANYLYTLATKAKLNVQCSTEVRAVRPLGGGEGFEVTVVPAGGEPTRTLTPTPTPSVTPTRTRTRTLTPTPTLNPNPNPNPNPSQENPRCCAAGTWSGRRASSSTPALARASSRGRSCAR